jgi:hypothetical protein
MSEANNFERARDALLSTEAELSTGFSSYAGAMIERVDDGCALLMTVLLSTPTGTASLTTDETGRVIGGDIDKLQLLAQITIGVRALRVIRAGVAVLRYGWEPEARAHDRILVELNAHRSAIVNDSSGVEAQAWLARERGHGIAKRVNSVSPPELYKNLSTDSHGDPLPVSRLMDEGTGALQIEPKRSRATMASLWLYAGFARDQAVIIAQHAGIELRGVEMFDTALRDAKRQAMS